MFTLWHSIGVRPCVYLGVLIDAFVYDGRGHTLTTLWTLTQADFHGDWPYETLLESHLFKEFTMCPDLSWSLREKLSVCHVTWLQSSETEQKRQIHFRWSQIYKETSPTTRQALHKGAVRGARHWHLRTCQHSITFPPQGGDLVPTCDCPPKKNDSIRPLIKRLKWHPISTDGVRLGWIDEWMGPQNIRLWHQWLLFTSRFLYQNKTDLLFK